MRSKKRSVVTVLVILVIILGLLGVGRLWLFHREQSFFAGRVVSIQDMELVLQNNRGESRIVLLAPDTKITGPPYIGEKLPVAGQRVFVVGRSGENGKTHAKLLMVLSLH